MITLLHDDVVKRLESLGYAAPPSDEWVLDFLIEKVTGVIKNECNIDAIPEGLHHTAVDMICGEFLFMKKGSGQLEGFDVEAAVKQINEGDTAITYAVTDSSITLDGLIDFLMNSGKSRFVTFRRFLW